ncbi:hypothetical protein ACIPSA_45590 [Streptomyces sp. NPDC086549]|uniref:hypothetical protein n=1 Tax=Streptomyces sp. NPDC086549 TaxID=3365752 RepID=UPI0037F407E5
MVLVIAVGLEVATASAKHWRTSGTVPAWVWPVLIGVMVLLFAIAFWGTWLIQKERLKEAEMERRALESAAERLRERMELPSLVNFNRVLLDKYHGIATDQATKAYRSSRFAMGVGLFILVIAFFAGWRLNAQGDRLFVGSVAALGTSFTAYLSRTYILTYERALQQLNQYFNQPVLNGYFLTAERLANSLPDDRRADALEQIVADVLESGKEMHRNGIAGNSTQGNASKLGRRRRAVQTDASLPPQLTQ